jgi:hypothetical protein
MKKQPNTITEADRDEVREMIYEYLSEGLKEADVCSPQGIKTLIADLQTSLKIITKIKSATTQGSLDAIREMYGI